MGISFGNQLSARWTPKFSSAAWPSSPFALSMCQLGKLKGLAEEMQYLILRAGEAVWIWTDLWRGQIWRIDWRGWDLLPDRRQDHPQDHQQDHQHQWPQLPPPKDHAMMCSIPANPVTACTHRSNLCTARRPVMFHLHQESPVRIGWQL